MKKRLLKPLGILSFFVAIVAAQKILLDENWLKSLFYGFALTLFWHVGMYFFANWWDKKAAEQKEKHNQ